MQRISSSLSVNMAWCDLLLLVTAWSKIKKEAATGFFDFENWFNDIIHCRSYHSIKQLCMLFSIMLVCTTGLSFFYYLKKKRESLKRLLENLFQPFFDFGMLHFLTQVFRE